jgi:multidrug resistance efflux pump
LGNPSFARRICSRRLRAGQSLCRAAAAEGPGRASGRAEVSEHFESTGNMAAINTVDLVARVQGFVQAISYADGDYVKKGTSLFTIEPEPYRLKVEAAKASVTSAQATLK